MTSFRILDTAQVLELKPRNHNTIFSLLRITISFPMKFSYCWPTLLNKSKNRCSMARSEIVVYRITRSILDEVLGIHHEGGLLLLHKLVTDNDGIGLKGVAVRRVVF